MIKYVSAGDSHGEMLIGILENIPAHLNINENAANFYLSLRRRGFGRGKRMLIENDRIKIVSGIFDGKTTGAPLGFTIRNRDFSINKTRREFSVPRPGHSDFSGSVKYNFQNVAIPSERTSARSTAADVAAGALLLKYLNIFNVEIFFYTVKIGSTHCNEFPFNKETFQTALSNDLLIPNKTCYENAKSEIQKAINDKDTVGGEGIVVVKNMPPGVGDYGNFQDKLDGIISQYVMSVPSVKFVQIGKFDSAKHGSEYHDAIFTENGHLFRKTNNAGGIEGGVSNGEDIVVRFGFKPIPTLLKGVSSVDLDDFSKKRTEYIRSDTSVVAAGTVVSAMRISLALSIVFSRQFSGDTVLDVKSRFREWISERRKFWQRYR